MINGDGGCCHGWITIDELGMVGVGGSWIKSNQINYGKLMKAW